MEVPEASRKIEMVVDPASLDLKARCYYALQLKRILGFVVVGKLDEWAHSTESGPGVSSIRNVDGLTDH